MTEPRKPRSPKIERLKPVVLDCLDTGRFRLTRHVILRMAERKITRMEIVDVLRGGGM